MDESQTITSRGEKLRFSLINSILQKMERADEHQILDGNATSKFSSTRPTESLL